MTGQSVIFVIAVLIGVLALAAAAGRLWQMRMQHAQPRSGRVLVLQESIALDPRRRIHLVGCGQRQVLLLTGGEQDLVIGWVQNT